MTGPVNVAALLEQLGFDAKADLDTTLRTALRELELARRRIRGLQAECLAANQQCDLVAAELVLQRRRVEELEAEVVELGGPLVSSEPRE